MADELKPCPFCGGAPTVVDDDSYGACYVFCGPCDVMPEQAYRNVGETAQAIAAWNRRAAPEPSEADVRLEERKWCVDVAREMGSQYGYEIAEEIERRSEPLARAALAALRAAKEKEHG